MTDHVWHCPKHGLIPVEEVEAIPMRYPAALYRSALEFHDLPCGMPVVRYDRDSERARHYAEKHGQPL